MPAHHFLVPIDFSADADYALAYALELARTLQAKLTLLHVIEPLLVSSVEIMPAPFQQALEDKMTEAMLPYHARVTAAGSRVTTPSGMACRSKSSLPRPAQPTLT